MNLNNAIDELLAAKVGRCSGCGAPGSWDEETRGSSADRPAVWAGCDEHHQATSVPIEALAYTIIANAARAANLSIDDYADERRTES